MKCPDDSTELQRNVYEGDVQVDQCPSCSGIWLDHTELESIQDLREKDYSDEIGQIPNYFDNSYDMALESSEGVFACPNCAREMEKKEYAYCSQIMIDVCPTCRGVWLHKDELSELEVFFEKCRKETQDMRKDFFQSLVSFFT